MQVVYRCVVLNRGSKWFKKINYFTLSICLIFFLCLGLFVLLTTAPNHGFQ